MNALDSGVRGQGSGASRGLGQCCPGCVHFGRIPAVLWDPGPLPVLKVGSDRAGGGGAGQGNLYFTVVLGFRLRTDAAPGPAGCSSRSLLLGSGFGVASGLYQAVGAGGGHAPCWGGVPRQEAWSAPIHLSGSVGVQLCCAGGPGCDGGRLEESQGPRGVGGGWGM